MASRIAAEIIIEIGMRVEVEDRHRPVTGRSGLDERKGHRMIAAEGKRNFSVFTNDRDVAADRGVVLRGTFGERQIAIVGQCDVGADFGAELARHIAAVAPQRGADRGRPGGSSALETAVDVGGKAEKADRGHGPLVDAGRVGARINGGRADLRERGGAQVQGAWGPPPSADRIARTTRPDDNQMSSPSSSGPAIISSATASVRLRIAASSRSRSSGFSVRKFFAFSRPCPMRIES